MNEDRERYVLAIKPYGSGKLILSWVSFSPGTFPSYKLLLSVTTRKCCLSINYSQQW